MNFFAPVNGPIVLLFGRLSEGPAEDDEDNRNPDLKKNDFHSAAHADGGSVAENFGSARSHRRCGESNVEDGVGSEFLGLGLHAVESLGA